jgi:hypothetical protein
MKLNAKKSIVASDKKGVKTSVPARDPTNKATEDITDDNSTCSIGSDEYEASQMSKAIRNTHPTTFAEHKKVDSIESSQSKRFFK